MLIIGIKIWNKACMCLRGLNKVGHSPQEITSIQPISEIKNSEHYQVDDSLDNLKNSSVKIAWQEAQN